MHFYAARDDFLLAHAHITPISINPDDPRLGRSFTIVPGYSPTGFFRPQTSPLRLPGCSAFRNLQPAASFCGQTFPPRLPVCSALRYLQPAAAIRHCFSEFTLHILDLLSACRYYVRQDPLDVAIPTVIICTAARWDFTRQLKGHKATEISGRVLLLPIIVTMLSNRSPFVHMVASMHCCLQSP